MTTTIEYGKIKTFFREATGEDINFQTLENRVKFQKVMYILKSAGIPLETKFNWYVMGPYSPELAYMGYRIIKEHIPMEKISVEEKRICEAVKNFLKGYPERTDQELVASLLYVKDNQKLSGEILVQELRNKKPQFEIEKIRSALDEIQISNLFE